MCEETQRCKKVADQYGVRMAAVQLASFLVLHRYNNQRISVDSLVGKCDCTAAKFLHHHKRLSKMFCKFTTWTTTLLPVISCHFISVVLACIAHQWIQFKIFYLRLIFPGFLSFKSQVLVIATDKTVAWWTSLQCESPPPALRPNAGHGLLILEVSRSHTMTHHRR